MRITLFSLLLLGLTGSALASEPVSTALPSDDDPPSPGLVLMQPSETTAITARLHLQVTAPQAALTSILELTKAQGGYMSERHGDNLTLRVPGEALAPLSEDIQGLGRLLDRSFRGEE